TGPGGDLFYTSRDSGQVRRISYAPGFATPVASIQSSALSGIAPLLVTFNAAASFDPDGTTLAFSWDLNGDGVYGDSTSAQTTSTYTSPGTYIVRLRVFNPGGLSDVRSVTVVVVPPDQATAPAITSVGSTTFTVGASGSYTVTATGTTTPSLSDS